MYSFLRDFFRWNFEGYVRYPTLGQCYQVYTRGPCALGQYVILPVNETIPSCQPNPCRQDNFVPFRGACFELDKSGPCKFPELGNVVGINGTTLQIICTKDDEIIQSAPSTKHADRGNCLS